MSLFGQTLGTMGAWAYRAARRTLTGYPQTLPAEVHLAWVKEQLQAYATPHPYAGPLTVSSDNISGETWEMRLGYRKMAVKEPSVKAALLTKCLAVCQLDPQIHPHNKADRRDRAIAKWCKHSVAASDGGWPKLLWNILIHSLVEGFSVNEKVLTTIDRQSDEYAGFWTLKIAKAKDTQHLRFRLDEFKNITAVQNMTAGQGGAPFAPEDFLIFTHLQFFENPFGISDLRAANRAANLIESAIKLRAILLENFSGPFLKATSPDSGNRSKIMSVLREARARGWIVMPENSTLDVINLATSAPDQFQNTIEDLRQEIVTAIQGAYLQLLEGGVSDGRGNTQVHKGVSELFQWWLAACAASTIQQHLFPDLIYPNYGRDVGLPRLTLGGLDPQAILQSLARFVTLQQLGVTLSLKQVMEEGGAESPEDDTDKLAPPSAQPQGGAPPPGGGSGPDLSSLFGPSPDDNPPGPDQGQTGQPPPQFADRAEGSTWSSGGRYYKREGGKTTRVPHPEADSARRAVHAAIDSPHAVEPSNLDELHHHLKKLTVKDFKDIKSKLKAKFGSGLKEDMAVKLVAAAKSLNASKLAKPSEGLAPEDAIAPRPARGVIPATFPRAERASVRMWGSPVELAKPEHVELRQEARRGLKDAGFGPGKTLTANELVQSAAGSPVFGKIAVAQLEKLGEIVPTGGDPLNPSYTTGPNWGKPEPTPETPHTPETPDTGGGGLASLWSRLKSSVGFADAPADDEAKQHFLFALADCLEKGDDEGYAALRALLHSPPASRQFSEEEYSALSFADRSHLVKKIVEDKNGIHRTVWVSPESGDHGDEAARLGPRADAESAVKKAIDTPGELTAGDLAGLAGALHKLTVAQKRDHLRAARLKVGGKKTELASRLLAHVRATKATARAPALAPVPAPRPSPPQPPPPLDDLPLSEEGFAPPAPRTATPPGFERGHLSESTRRTLDDVAAGRLTTSEVRTAALQFAGRLIDHLSDSFGVANGILAGYGAPEGVRAAFAGFTPRQKAAYLAHVVFSHAAGEGVVVPAAHVPTPAPTAPLPPPLLPPPPAAPRGPRRQIPAPTDPPRMPTGVTFQGLRDSELKARTREIFGRDVEPAHLAAMVNAHDGATVTVTSYRPNELEVSVRGRGYQSSRTVEKGPDGKVYVKNHYFRVDFDRNSSPPPDWVQANPAISGGELLSNQVRAARAAGVTKLKTHAAGTGSDLKEENDPNRTMNGFYTWPRLGYDDSIPDYKYRILPAALKRLVDRNPTGSRKSKSILGLMSTEAGRKWWKENGTDLFDCEFDLTPGSLSMRTMAKYNEERNRGGAAG